MSRLSKLPHLSVVLVFVLIIGMLGGAAIAQTAGWQRPGDDVVTIQDADAALAYWNRVQRDTTPGHERLWLAFGEMADNLMGLDIRTRNIELTPGPAGPPGDDGAPGADGAPGPPGADGVSGYERVIVDVTLPADGSSDDVNVSCPAGKSALGSGQVSGDAIKRLDVWRNGPSGSDPADWIFTYTVLTGGAGRPVKFTLICATVLP